jgi:hypothetical protein
MGESGGSQSGIKSRLRPLPLEITIEGTNYEEKGKGGAEEGNNKVWDQQGMKEYRRIEEATRSQSGIKSRLRPSPTRNYYRRN